MISAEQKARHELEADAFALAYCRKVNMNKADCQILYQDTNGNDREETEILELEQLAEAFAAKKDIQRLIISGMITILLGSGLLIADIFPPKMCAFVVGFLWWFLSFYCCNSIRFVSIFVSLIVEGQSKSEEKESDECQEQSEKHKEIKNRLDNKLPKF